jgi:hypothetical protein
MITEREKSAGKTTNIEAQLPNGKAMTDRELMDKAWDYLASYTVGERPNASEVNDFIAVIEDRMNQPEQKLMIDCPRCGHCCPERKWVGLTNDEIKSLPSWWPSYEDAPALIELVKDVETKLKEKNMT